MRFYEPNPTYAGIDAVGYKVSTDFRLRLKSGFEKSFIEVKKMCERK